MLLDWIAGVLRDGGPTLVGLGGLSVATLTLWLVRRERRKELRQRLFDVRVDASIEIAASAVRVPRAWRRLERKFPS